jgi:hypothetical protein
MHPKSGQKGVVRIGSKMGVKNILSDDPDNAGQNPFS